MNYYKHLREEKGRAAMVDKCRVTGKVRFADSETALRRARKWLADALRGTYPPNMGAWKGDYLRAFPCKHCGGWHLTHEPFAHGRVNPLLEVHA